MIGGGDRRVGSDYLEETVAVTVRGRVSDQVWSPRIDIVKCTVCGTTSMTTHIDTREHTRLTQTH